MNAQPDPSVFTTIGDAAFVSLTTFRKTGVPVSTPVWIARDGDVLLVTTPEESGKVKRLRNSGRVELRESSRMGKVADGAPIASGIATILADNASTEYITAIFKKKYGTQYRVVMLIERIAARRQKKRVFLRITPS